MNICRLCLQSFGEHIMNDQEILDVLKAFLPYMNSVLKHPILHLCEICLSNIKTLINFNSTIKKTSKEIDTGTAPTQKSNKKINLTNLLETQISVDKNFSLCRVCLKIVSVPQIFLFENDTNILRHELIFSMLKFCNVTLNCDLCEKHIMCLQCWENLQVCYSFKWNYIETSKKIRAYSKLFNISVKDMTDDVLNKMGKFFCEHPDETLTDDHAPVKNEFDLDNLDTSGYSLRKRTKKEQIDIFKNEKQLHLDIKNGPNSTKRKQRHQFTSDEDAFLLKTHSEFVVDKRMLNRPWKLLQDKWMQKYPSKFLSGDSIRSRVSLVLRKQSKAAGSKTCLPMLKPTLKKISVNDKVVNIFGESSSDKFLNQDDSDSDDTFVDEVIPSSFVPKTKSEPLSDNEEMYIIEPKIASLRDCPPSDTDSDIESLPIPLLERMDMPVQLIGDHVCSKDVKAETLNMIIVNGSVDPNTAVEDYKTFKRITKKQDDHENTLYKCTRCNFETKYQYSADRHSNWHCDPEKKGFECPDCPFMTSKYFLLKHHLATKHQNKDDEELPVLLPFTI